MATNSEVGGLGAIVPQWVPHLEPCGGVSGLKSKSLPPRVLVVGSKLDLDIL